MVLGHSQMHWELQTELPKPPLVKGYFEWKFSYRLYSFCHQSDPLHTELESVKILDNENVKAFELKMTNLKYVFIQSEFADWLYFFEERFEFFANVLVFFYKTWLMDIFWGTMHCQVSIFSTKLCFK